MWGFVLATVWFMHHQLRPVTDQSATPVSAPPPAPPAAAAAISAKHLGLPEIQTILTALKTTQPNSALLHTIDQQRDSALLLRQNATVFYLAAQGEWIRVKTPAGVEGFVHHTALKVSDR